MAKTGRRRRAQEQGGGEQGGELLPVTVLSGFLGAGKTTLLKHILRSASHEGRPGGGEGSFRVAVIVNDMGEVNLDASEIKNSRLIQEEASMVELHNGCICCTLRGDLLKTVKALSEEASFDYLVIESTGISEPLPVAATFVMDVDEAAPAGQAPPAEAERRSLSHFARIDTMVTVVDALNIYEVLNSLKLLSEQNASGMVGNTGLAESDGDAATGGDQAVDNRSIAQLMLDQIEFADVLLLSKVALLLEKQPRSAVDEIVALLRKLNPLAQVHAPEDALFQSLPLDAVVSTRLFNMGKAQSSAGWLRELALTEQGGPGHTPETEEYGISSLVFRTRERPFHPVRLQALLSTLGDYESSIKALVYESGHAFSGVVRAKGQLWVATSHAYPVDFQVAGRHVHISPSARPYLAAIPEGKWPQGAQMVRLRMMAMKQWTKEYGDREVEAVFIGVRLQKAALVAELEKALLTDAEMAGGPESWRALEDVFFGGDYFELRSEAAGDAHSH